MARPGKDLVTTLIRLHEALEATALPLDLKGVSAARKSTREAMTQLEDYVLPRALQIEAPLLAVVGGSTGAGKSTLVNSIVGTVVTEAGVLRPTTRSPVLVYNPDDAEWFTEARILPDFRRTTTASGDSEALQLVAAATVPQGIAILDAPDVDSLEVRNRELAAQLLSAADMWLFVTSAARYADEVPWGFLRQAAERRAAVAVVLDRTKPEAVAEVSAHLNRMLVSRGLRDSPLFKVAESKLDDEGLLPAAAVVSIQTWLEALAADADVRAAVIRQTLDGAIRSLGERAYSLADACAGQEDAARDLTDAVRETFDTVGSEFTGLVESGAFLSSEVRRGWDAHVTAEALLGESTLFSRARDRLRRVVGGDAPTAGRVAHAATAPLQAAIRSCGDGACDRVEKRWRASKAGKGLLRRGRVTSEVGLVTGSGGAVDAWLGAVAGLTTPYGSSDRERASIATALQVAVLAGDADRDGVGRQAVSVLTASVGQEPAARLLAASSRALADSTGAVFESLRQQYVARLGEHGLDGGHAERIRDLARTLDDLRILREDWT